MDSKIDWTKPLRVTKGLYEVAPYVVTVLQEDGGNRLITWRVGVRQ